MAWKYQSDEGIKRKHHWDKPIAGFTKVHGSIIGKCPSSILPAEAELLLNEGIPFSGPHWIELYPKRIYGIKDGVIYCAVPTIPGASYHGYPELPATLRRLPGTVRDKIMELAKKKGCEKEARRWINQ